MFYTLLLLCISIVTPGRSNSNIGHIDMNEILDKQKRLQEFEQNANSTLQQRNRELMQPIYSKIMEGNKEA